MRADLIRHYSDRSSRLRTAAVYGLPLLAGLVVRILYFVDWHRSAFRFYHVLYGLDMRKLLASGENFYEGKTAFSAYSLFVAFVRALAGSEELPLAVVVAQMLLGLGSIALTVFAARRIFSSDIVAISAGLLLGIYAPLVIYESHILKASFYMFVSLVSLACAVYVYERGFKPASCLVLGALSLVPFFVRHSGLLWILMVFCWVGLCVLPREKGLIAEIFSLSAARKLARPLGLMLAGALGIIILVMAVNFKNGQPLLDYFKPNYQYLLSTGAREDGHISRHFEDKAEKDGIAAEKGERGLAEKIWHYALKLRYIFGPMEMPNNINYYFMKSKLPFAQFLPGPGSIIPLALAGMALILVGGGLRREKDFLAFIYIVAFAAPMLLFLPLSRYKLVMLPVFALAGGYTIGQMYLIMTRRQVKGRGILPPALLLGFLFISYLSDPAILRASDTRAYLLAAVSYPDRLMREGRFAEASDILDDYYISSPDCELVAIYYAASLMGIGKPVDAELVLNSMGIPEDAGLYPRYFYELAESQRLQGNMEMAARNFRVVLEIPAPEALKALAARQLEKIRTVPPE